MSSWLTKITWPIDAAISWTTNRALENARSGVHDPARFAQVQKWSLLRLFLNLVVALGFILAVPVNLPWIGFALWMWLYVLANIGSRGQVREAQSHMAGWVEGRFAMVASMNEAMQRGMGMDEWLRSEIERDSMMMARAYGMGERDG